MRGKKEMLDSAIINTLNNVQMHVFIYVFMYGVLFGLICITGKLDFTYIHPNHPEKYGPQSTYHMLEYDKNHNLQYLYHPSCKLVVV